MAADFFDQKRYEDYVAASLNCISPLFAAGFEKGAFDMLCTLLRVDGIQSESWDPYEESREAADNYVRLLNQALVDDEPKAICRLMLLIYCQLTEMSDVHHMLYNTLACCAGEAYSVRPLRRIGRRKKKQSSSFVPPSAATKFSAIVKKARDIQQHEIANIIEGFWDPELRNSFSHSDYILTGEEYRMTEGGHPRAIPLATVIDKYHRCSAFYAAFFHCHVKFRKELMYTKRYHKWPQYEVLELLADQETGINGFTVHFSNGERATFRRTARGTDAMNLRFESGGTVNFFVGPLWRLGSEWKIAGRIATEADFAAVLATPTDP